MCKKILGDMTLALGKRSFKYRREENKQILRCYIAIGGLHVNSRFSVCMCAYRHRSIDTDVHTRVCWDGRGKGEMSLAQLVVPVIRDRSRKDWLLSEGHTKLLEGAPTGTCWG